MTRVNGTGQRMLTRVLLWAIAGYRRSGGGRRWFGVDCNFEPSCSAFTQQAIERFGAQQGSRLAWQRIRRCTERDSFCKCLEPVPDKVGQQC